MDLATRICWCGPNVWLKTGTGRFALPNTAANLRDPHKEANFLIGWVNYQLLGEDWYKKVSIATYVPNRLTQRGQADRLRQRNVPTCHSDTCYRCQLAGGAHIFNNIIHHSGYRTASAQTKCITEIHILTTKVRRTGSVKRNVFPVNAMKPHGKMKVQLHTFFILAPHTGERSTSWLGHHIPYRVTGDWVSHRPVWERGLRYTSVVPAGNQTPPLTALPRLLVQKRSKTNFGRGLKAAR